MVELICSRCGEKYDCESWNVKEIEEGRIEQLCDRCKSLLEEEQNCRS